MRLVTLPALVLGRGTEAKRSLAAGFAILIAFSLVLASPMADAQNGLTLPTTPVRMEASNGTLSYFNTTLSDIAQGYDVTNGSYPGWCVDTTAEMTRSPAIHTVSLYSSIDAPGELGSQRWDMVNYILNHKQGTAQDIQQAIWYFVNSDGNFTPSSTTAWAIVNDALTNGSGFVPKRGQVIAIICFPLVLLPTPTSIQITVIELTVPPLTGDITGPDGTPDGRVDMRDIGLVARHFQETVPPAPPILDLYQDGKIDMRDIGIVARHFGDHHP